MKISQLTNVVFLFLCQCLVIVVAMAVWKLNVYSVLEKILYFKYWAVLTVTLKEMLKMESN